MMSNRGVALAACVFIAGCAGQGAPTGVVSPIQQQADDFKITVAQGALAGAFIGGITGAIVGGGDSEKIVTGALAGAAGGALGGYIIAGQKQEYASREDALNSVIADSDQRNQKLARLVTTTDSVVGARRQQLAKLNAERAATAAKQQEKQQLLAELQADKRALDGALQSAREHQDQMNQNIAELRRQFPDSDVSRLEQISGNYRGGLQGLEQRNAEIIDLIQQTSDLTVSS